MTSKELAINRLCNRAAIFWADGDAHTADYLFGLAVGHNKLTNYEFEMKYERTTDV